MLSTVLFISGGEIFIILLAILIFFGADKIPEFARMMGKGVREFKKATDDIKRELNESSSGVMDDIKSIRDDLSSTIDKEISAPVQETVNETAAAVEEGYQDPYNYDYYYNNQEYSQNQNNEYTTEAVRDDKIQSDSTETDTEKQHPESTDDSSKNAEA